VVDTGPGISEEALERLFVPFERLTAEFSGVEGTASACRCPSASPTPWAAPWS
jgi:hypothetical protein